MRSKVKARPWASYHGPCQVQRAPYSRVSLWLTFQLSCPNHSNCVERRLARTSWFTWTYSAKCSVLAVHAIGGEPRTDPGEQRHPAVAQPAIHVLASLGHARRLP